MDAAGKRRSPSRNGSNATTLKGVLIRTAAWIVAVPALCATVIVGGAVPLYLLLPDVKPSATVSAPASKPAALASARPAASPAKAASNAPARPDEPARERAATVVPAASDEPPAETAEDVASTEPTDAPVETPEEPQVATVTPTPRPEPPVQAPPTAAPSPADEGKRQEAALEPPSPQAETPRAETPSSPKAGKRDVILRTVTLRAGPKGRELGSLRQGTPVLVGRCDEWCEVRADGASGWIHPSFLVKSGAAQRDGNRAVRQVERRRPARDRDSEWLAEDKGRRYGRYGDDLIEGPPAAFYEERPRVLRRRTPPPQFYEYYD